MLNGWSEESAALGTAVKPPFDRWCPTTTPGAPTPSPTLPESTTIAAAEAEMRAKILQISSPKNDAATKADIEPETAALADFLATWNMNDYVRHQNSSLHMISPASLQLPSCALQNSDLCTELLGQHRKVK